MVALTPDKVIEIAASYVAVGRMESATVAGSSDSWPESVADAKGFVVSTQ
jgi:hypothetical protein